MATKLDADWISRFTLCWRSNQFTEAKGHLCGFGGGGGGYLWSHIPFEGGGVGYLGVGYPDKGGLECLFE